MAQLSMFGGLEGDTPDTEHCPACGGASSGGRCSRCRDRGYEAPTLQLIAGGRVVAEGTAESLPVLHGSARPSYQAAADISAWERENSRPRSAKETARRMAGTSIVAACDLPAPAPDNPHPCPECGAPSRGYMLMTGHKQRECSSCHKTWLYT